MLGPPFFGYFLQRLKKVTRAIARKSAMTSADESESNEGGPFVNWGIGKVSP